MERIFDIVFWFNLMPQPLSGRSVIFFALFFGFFFLLYLATYYIYAKRKGMLERPEKELFDRVRPFLLTSWLLGWLWLFFAYEGVRFFSARFWLVVWGIMVIMWIYSLSRYAFMEMPLRLRKLDERRTFSKYLPRRKK